MSSTLASRCICVAPCAAFIFAVFASGPRAHAASIVFGDIEYTRDGRVDDEARSSIEAYLEFFLSRLQHSPQRIAVYLRQCTSGNQPKPVDSPCPFPDFYIQLRIAERQGEVQISGAVGRKIDGEHADVDLETIRVKLALGRRIVPRRQKYQCDNRFWHGIYRAGPHPHQLF